MANATPAVGEKHSINDVRVFWGCFIALVTCAFGFVVRTIVIDEWAIQFKLSETEKGDILGVGFWPFAFSIFLFSLIIDKIGSGRVAMIGFVLHAVSTAILVTANSYASLYWGTFLFALSNGTVEAYINPVVATMFSKQKTKWLNILHAGWPGGSMLAGVIVLLLLPGVSWQIKVGITFVPTAVYAILLLGTRFPISERVAAGVTYREMLADFGALGAFVATYLIAVQVFDGIVKIQPAFLLALIPAAVVAIAFGGYVKSIGQPIFFFLLLIMIPLATTELGVDSWVGDLMGGEMGKLGLAGGWVLVYTMLIMTVLRFCAGPIVHRIAPLPLLAISAAVAALGLVALSGATGALILGAATLYGVGKTFFWPTMLGVVSERFPKGGALTLNTIGGVGMLGLSIGGVFLGNIQDTAIDKNLAANSPALHAKYVTEAKTSVFGGYRAFNDNVTVIRDKAALYEAKLNLAKSTTNKLLGDKAIKAEELGKILTVADLIAKANDPKVAEALADAKLDAELAKDAKYQTTVRFVFDRHGPKAPAADASEADKKAHEAAKAAHEAASADFAKQLAYLSGKGLLASGDEYKTTLHPDIDGLNTAIGSAKKGALTTVAILPVIMLVCYLILIFYFKSRGGYTAVELDTSGKPHETSRHPKADEAMADGETGPAGQA